MNWYKDVFIRKEDDFKYANTQIDLPGMKSKIEAWRKENLEDDWMQRDDMESADGHVTVFYGLTETDSDKLKKSIRDAIKDFDKSIKVKIGALDMFDNEGQDVLIATIESDDLNELNALLAELPNKNEHDEYVPHMTIAYLKKGQAKQFKGQKPFDETFETNYMKLSDRQGNKSGIRLKSK
jgi:2'-5' RNA ligase